MHAIFSMAVPDGVYCQWRRWVRTPLVGQCYITFWQVSLDKGGCGHMLLASVIYHSGSLQWRRWVRTPLVGQCYITFWQVSLDKGWCGHMLLASVIYHSDSLQWRRWVRTHLVGQCCITLRQPYYISNITPTLGVQTSVSNTAVETGVIENWPTLFVHLLGALCLILFALRL